MEEVANEEEMGKVFSFPFQSFDRILKVTKFPMQENFCVVLLCSFGFFTSVTV